MVIDKVEVRVPQEADFRPEFHFLRRDFHQANYSGYVRPARFYAGTVNLRLFGLDAILHAAYRFGSRKDHKLEILQTGKKSLDDMSALISHVFDVSPRELRIMRLDFASDLYGVPVTFLHSSLRVKFKRSSDERGELEYEVVGSRKLEYLRFGKAPNCVRAYDKPAECKARFPEVLKSVSPDGEQPTFEQAFGFPENTILSRVERQAGGARVPVECNSFGKLYAADRFDPFTNIEVTPTGIPVPDPADYDPSEIQKIMGTEALIQKFGLQNARSILNRGGNGKRLFEPYAAYVRKCQDVLKLSREDISNTYQESVSKQIRGANKPSRIWPPQLFVAKRDSAPDAAPVEAINKMSADGNVVAAHIEESLAESRAWRNFDKRKWWSYEGYLRAAREAAEGRRSG